jgi:hypothetical protein
VCQGGGAVAQIVQADRGKAGRGHQRGQAVGEKPRVQGSPWRLVNRHVTAVDGQFGTCRRRVDEVTPSIGGCTVHPAGLMRPALSARAGKPALTQTQLTGRRARWLWPHLLQRCR